MQADPCSGAPLLGVTVARMMRRAVPPMSALQLQHVGHKGVGARRGAWEACRRGASEG